MQKYPRTVHFPWSPGASNDDVKLDSVDHFKGKLCVITEKMDGENTTIYQDGIHARSLDSGYHPSRTWVKALQAKIGSSIPKKWRICGENLYAKHSIGYENLSSFFQVFSIWDDKNNALSWKDTLEWAELLELKTVPVLAEGVFNSDYKWEDLYHWKEFPILYQERAFIDKSKAEGYVLRVAESFHFSEFKKSVAKYVRKGHVQTDKHWLLAPMIPNKQG
jgi:hypothetical protein